MEKEGKTILYTTPGARLDLVNEETMAILPVDGETIRVTVPARDYVIIGNFR